METNDLKPDAPTEYSGEFRRARSSNPTVLGSRTGGRSRLRDSGQRGMVMATP
jgi:hypothetical protein